jgi:hypothetical protein
MAVQANAAYKLVSTMTAIEALGLAPWTRFHNRSPSVRPRAHDIRGWLRQCSNAKEQTLFLTAEVA